MIMIDWYICFDPKTVNFKLFRFVTKMYIVVYLRESVSRDGDVSLNLNIYIYIYISCLKIG